MAAALLRFSGSEDGCLLSMGSACLASAASMVSKFSSWVWAFLDGLPLALGRATEGLGGSIVMAGPGSLPSVKSSADCGAEGADFFRLLWSLRGLSLSLSFGGLLGFCFGSQLVFGGRLGFGGLFGFCLGL